MLYEKNADQGGYLYFLLYQSADKRERELAPIPHFHNSIELCIVKKGCVSVFINGERHILEAGDVAFIDRLTPHTHGFQVTEENPLYYVVVASATLLSGIGWLKKETLPTVTHRKEGFDDLIRFVDMAYEKINFRNAEIKLGFTTLLLGSLYEYCGHIPRRTEKSNRLIVDIMIYLCEHFREDLRLEDLASSFGYEKTYLSRTFNKYMGMNLREYLNRLRIDAVLKERRDNPDVPIYKIAEACGFENQNTFYRALNKYSSNK